MTPKRDVSGAPGATEAPHARRWPPWSGPLIVVAAGALIRAPLLTWPGFLPDQQMFFFWGFLSNEHGLAHVYDTYELNGRQRRWCNYPPVFVYACAAMARVYPLVAGRPFDLDLIRDAAAGANSADARAAYALFKLPAVAADLAIATLLCVWLRRRVSERVALAVVLVYAVQPAVVHNSTVWGQVDSIHTLWMLLSVEAAARRRAAAMGAWAALAVMTKPQALLLAPIWAGVVAWGGGWTAAARRTATAFGVAAVVVAVLGWPFGFGADSGLRDVYLKAVGYYPYQHFNGFSAWFLGDAVAAPDAEFRSYLRDDVALAPGITPRTLGMGAFWCMAAAALVVMARRRFDGPSMRWAACVLPLAFFVLPTQIHERYLFPAVALWAWGMPASAGWCAGWIVLGGCAALNALWVFPGPAYQPPAGLSGGPLRELWLGRPVGVWCALALIGLLLFALSEPLRTRWRASTTPENR